MSGESVDDSHVFGGPIYEGGLAVDQLARHWSEIAAVARNRAVIAHDEILPRRNHDRVLRSAVVIFSGHIWLGQQPAVDVRAPIINSKLVARLRDHSLDVALLRIAWVVKHHHISAMNVFKVIHKLVNEEPVLISQARQHARALNPHRLIKKSDDEKRDGQRKQHVAAPQPKTAPALFPTHQLQPGLPKGHRMRCLGLAIGCCCPAGAICACPRDSSALASCDSCRTRGLCRTISTEVPEGMTMSLPRVTRV